MPKSYPNVYQFKIALKGVSPPIWRRIQVPDSSSFWDLHVAIQDAMGWEDYHLHEFTVVDPRVGGQVSVGIPSADDWGDSPLPGWKCKIARYFSLANPKGSYVYDFGDDWRHTVTLEKILPRDRQTEYPVCLAGKRACPPEDCGGIWGYQELLQIIADPTHERHAEMIEWLGEPFDPQKFDPKSVFFSDARQRLQIVLDHLT
jgi:hypothetical protein